MTEFEADVMLLKWNEGSGSGATIILQLADIDDLLPFKAMTVKKGGIAGQMLKATFKDVDDNGHVVPDPPPKAKHTSKFPGGFCGLAVMWSRERQLTYWLMDNFPSVHSECLDAIAGFDCAVEDDLINAWCIKKICGVKSRKELDTDDVAGAIFDTQIRQPYMKHRKEIGLE